MFSSNLSLSELVNNVVEKRIANGVNIAIKWLNSIGE